MRGGPLLLVLVAACAVPDAVFDNPLDPVNLVKCDSMTTPPEEAVEPEAAIAGNRHIKTLAGQTFEFSYIAAGTFTMGTFTMGTTGNTEDEYPHSVTLTKAFLLQRTETTQAQYQAVIGSNPSYFRGDSQRPVEQVSWTSAVAYCDKLSQLEGVTAGTYGLPTEAQWEYAARAGTTGSTYGNLADIAWYSSNSGSTTRAVKGKLPNTWNLYDMLGNVWEWTGDWYGSYPQSPVTDTTGAASGSYRVFRGGGWYDSASGVRASQRNSNAPSNTGFYLGFRPLRSLP